jgi:5-guanidino-2-oxopentanoate decarboxylase
MSMTCGEATMRLLARYGVTTVFGIPGVHTLDLCRGLSGGANAGAIHHVRARNEQGAGYMAEGWARATGQVGVAVVISGPGVTNAATAVGQCYADSLPMLLISAEPDSRSLGKGWGVLHEITDQKRVTEPMTAFSATAACAADIPDLMARAFAVFASSRPRPVHISLPMDVQAEMVDDIWEPVPLPGRPAPDPSLIAQAADLLRAAKRPLILIGGGANGASADLTAITDMLGAAVIPSSAGKGIIADDHPLSLSASMGKPEVRDFAARADVILAVGTELAETDSYVPRMDLPGDIIRVDIDPAKISDLYPPKLGIVGDAGPAMAALRGALGNVSPTGDIKPELDGLRASIEATLNPSERQHMHLSRLLDDCAPEGIIWSADATQIAYTALFGLPTRAPRRWMYPAGFCALGNALPNAIGAKMAYPSAPVAVIVGDGGFMFTMPELMAAAEQGMSLPIILWNNGALKQIRDDMDLRDIERVGVEGLNPNFAMLARSCHCAAAAPDSEAAFRDVFAAALRADRPTLIEIHEDSEWLLQ